MYSKLPWVGYHVAGSNPELRIVAFHAAGSDATMYKKIFSSIKSKREIDLVAVQLPGRGGRTKESLPTNYVNVVDELFTGLLNLPNNDMPTIFLGYSMGAVLAFELALKFEEARLNVKKLIVCARTAPSYKRNAINRGTLTDEALTKIILQLGGTPQEIMQNKDLMTYYLKILRADFLIIDEYSKEPKNQITVPIYAATGIYDEDTPLISMEYWKKFTTNNFHLNLFEGGHFFIHSNHDEFSDYINKIIYD